MKYVGLWPILLKKSVEAVDQIFLASWVKFATKCAEDRMLRRRRDVCRSKWDYEADNSRSSMSLCFEQLCRGPVPGTFSTESALSGRPVQAGRCPHSDAKRT